MDKKGDPRFRVGVGYGSIGKVKVSHWDAEEKSWE
jgi:hypothetical protein